MSGIDYRFEVTDDPRFVRIVLTEREVPPRPPPMLPDEAEAYAVAAMADGTADRLADAFKAMEAEGWRTYRRMIEAVANSHHVHEAFREAFHENWVERSFRHREHLADDALLIRALRRIFPPYSGGNLILYRGERAAEFEAGRVGLNWSTDESIALMFARGLCSTYPGGGVLLRTEAAPAAIISTPNDYSSTREREHIIEPALLTGITEIDRFPYRPD